MILCYYCYFVNENVLTEVTFLRSRKEKLLSLLPNTDFKKHQLLKDFRHNLCWHPCKPEGDVQILIYEVIKESFFMICKREGRRKPFVSLLRTALDMNIHMCWERGIPDDDDGEGAAWGKVRAWSLHPCGKFFEALMPKKCCIEINGSGVHLEIWTRFSDANMYGSIAQMLGKVGNHWIVKPEGHARELVFYSARTQTSWEVWDRQELYFYLKM